MNAEGGFKLHPGAASDITSIWEFIAKDNPLAAKRVREDILDAIRRLVPFPHQGHQSRDLTSRPVRFRRYAIILRGGPHQRASSLLPSIEVKATEFGPLVRPSPADPLKKHGGFTSPTGNTGNRGAVHVSQLRTEPLPLSVSTRS